MWTRTWGTPYFDEFTSVRQTLDGGFVAAGTLDYYLWLVRTNSSGDTLWTKIDECGLSGHSVELIPDGGYVIAGDYFSAPNDLGIFRKLPCGNASWTIRLGGATTRAVVRWR